MATTTPAGVRGGLAKHGGHGGGGDHGGHGGHGGRSGSGVSAGSGASDGTPMTHRQIMEALTGLLLGMFVAILSSTVVSNALPEIISDLGGGQSAYTWVVTASLLAMTATTPLWGKLSDLFSKKLLVQIALIIYVLGSVVAGLSTSSGMLIACRVVQGIGVGGLSALAQIVMAAMIAPRERGRYSGYLGAVFAVATVGGPLLGGVITDTSWMGWRWCFYVGVPFAIIALIVLQKTLKLPVVKREGVKVDWAGAFFISAAVSLLLVWVTFAGDKYDWLSWQTYVMVAGSVLLGAVFVLIESRAAEPIIPLRLFRNRTITLASVASLFVGVAMFAGTVFFSQYFQLARGKSPTMSGVMTIPMIAGLFLSSTISGLVITRTGRWKAWLVSGGFLVTAGLGLLGTIRYDTEYWHVAVYMFVMGLGIGMMMQNLVLATQNQVAPEDLGSASSVVTFFRSLGGAIGVSALGAVLGNRVTHYVKDGIAALGPEGAAFGHGGTGGGGIPDLDKLPEPFRTVMEAAYGHGVGDVFLYAAPCALIAFVVTLFIKEVALKSSTTGNDSPQGEAAAGADPVEAEVPAAVGATGAVSEGAAGVTSVDTAAAVTPYGTGQDAVTPYGTTVRGVVRGAEGAPVARAAVTLISLGGRQLGRSVAQADGTYALDAPGSGSYVLIASADGFQPQASTVVVGGEPLAFDILLSGTSGLAGTVRATESGAPVEGAMVIVTDVRGDVLATGTSGPAGEFAFGELVPGSVTVAVNAAGFRPLALPVEIGGQGVTRVEAALRAGSLVRGTVRAGAARSPLADARVTLIDAAGNVVATATTGEDGAYAFTDLDAGEYSVVATGYPPVAGPLTVSGQGIDGHDIELAHPDA
ncbi:DHA2 family efflux MFS transporter permease subunit [Streptomyces griseus]|uniref:DHA2 family efflux MFS transporter permease subunit n=2 Tax=Streptomyces TaxID=1883 RepID=A0ABU2W6V0_9ACTN|nr:DHA2 family efflux MFS transporter permease subunit [Streptomyces griseus]MDT0493334.1 DHA2 family efflux MFS transporter permease subunit [Streptomyces griseus]